jgi:hypothetical protein
MTTISFFDPWIRDGQKLKIRIRDEHPGSYGISESLETIYRAKIFKFFDADEDPGSGINIPDPQH